MKSFWTRLFGPKVPTPAEVPRDDATLLALITPLAVPAVLIAKSARPARSYFGGDPRLPADISWPTRGSRPLYFLARLSLVELQAAGPIDWLPASGALLFFYDAAEQPWGFDPKDRDGHVVLHVPDLDAPVAPLERVPQTPAPALPSRTMSFRRMTSYPSWERDAMQALALSDAESERVMDFATRAFANEPMHQIGGFPAPIQSDGMELECQLASSGVYVGDSKGYQDPRVSALTPGATRWRLLLQLDTDEALDLQWGDGGRLYLWIDESAARAGRFTDTWVVLQCY